MKYFVSTNWVYKNLNNKKMIIFDCSWHLPNTKKNASKDFENGHIRNSQFFDIDKISEKNTKLPHMTPKNKIFQNVVRNFGVNKNSIIITYDKMGIFSSARVWWLFKYFGHKNIFVMNGGLKKWLKEEKPITKNIRKYKKGNFVTNENINLKANTKLILKNLNNFKYTILDARNHGRFMGKEKEPRRGLRNGHIPNSKNLFWGDLINYNGTIKTKKRLNEIFNLYKINNKKIITTCGSGITACILSIALLHSRNIQTKVYDGSWCEWGFNKKLPIEI